MMKTLKKLNILQKNIVLFLSCTGWPLGRYEIMAEIISNTYKCSQLSKVHKTQNIPSPDHILYQQKRHKYINQPEIWRNYRTPYSWAVSKSCGQQTRGFRCSGSLWSRDQGSRRSGTCSRSMAVYLKTIDF